MTECVAIAGWAHDRHCWDPVRQPLAQAHVSWRDGDWQALCVKGVDAGRLIAQTDAVTLIGWSLGAMLALSCALASPASVAGLVLIGGSARFTEADDYPGTSTRELRALRLAYRRSPERCYTGFLERCLHPIRDRACIQRGVEAALRIPVDAALAGLDYLAEADLRDRVSAVTCPVVLIHGEADEVIPATHSDWLARSLPNARAVRVPGAGHALSQPIMAALLKAIKELGGI